MPKTYALSNSDAKFILLDRDGVLNKDTGYVHRWEDWQWCDGVVESCGALHEAGYRLIVVTNQSGVGRGIFTDQDFRNLMAKVQIDYCATRGHDLSCIWELTFLLDPFYCPDHPNQASSRRKPGTGLWDDLISPWLASCFGPIDIENSWFLDDKFENLDFGRKVGLNLAWITDQEDDVREPIDYEPYRSLHHFTEQLLGKKI